MALLKSVRKVGCVDITPEENLTLYLKTKTSKKTKVNNLFLPRLCEFKQMEKKTSCEYEEAFKGTREMALSAMQKLQLEIKAAKDNDGKDSNKRQLQLVLMVLRTICTVAAKPEGKHYSIYCETLIHVLGKYIQPSVSAKYWTFYLEHVRYLHYIVADKKMDDEAQRICDLVVSYPSYLQSEGDYKILLGMFLQQLLSQYHHKRVNAKLAQEHSTVILEMLKNFFIEMLRCNKDQNFQYPELIADFVEYLVPKRVSSVFNFLASLPANKTQMYDSFFTLLKDLRTSEPTKEVLHAQCQRHIEALCVFFQLDVPDRLQQQLALRHLRACREMTVFANDKSSNYVFSLLYYLVKLTYGLPNPGEFKDVYKDLSQKLNIFFEKYGEMLMKERWFTDVPVVITVLLTHLQQSPTTPYACFWQQMNNIECYIAHFELILGCIRLAPRIVETKLLKIDCCTSARKHTIVSLLITALAALASYAATADESTTEDEELFVSFRTQVLLVMKHGVSVLDSLQCITTDTTELKLIYSRFIQLIPELRTLPLKRLGITLAEFLVRVRHKLSVKDWTTLLRRLYKMMLQTEETNLTTELQAAHIASMMQEQPWPDLSLLRSRIGYFHSASPHVASGQSISQLTLESHSPLKVFLDAPQTHLLHWLEMQHFLRYLKSNEQLQINLMRCSPTIYYETLIARISEKMSTAVSSRLRELKKDLELKKEKTVGLTRLEHLCWAQINTALFHDDLQMNKEMLAVEIKTNEDYLEDLLQSKEFTTVTIANEVKLINQAATALQSFREFYEKADSEPITSDEVFIDWDALVDDLTSLALFMQLAGYTNLATEAWILHYRITNTICDEYGSLRSLQYFFEKNEYFLNSTTHGINLVEEIERKQNFLLNAMQQLPKIVKKYQNHLLMCLCHLACYYAKIGHMSYAQILLKYVSQIHDELPTQLGKYNVVLGTVDVVKFRILWKHLHMGQSKISSKLAQRSLVRHMENTLERFRGDFFKLSTSELLNYSILLMSLIEEVAECAANRLCDQFVNSFFAGILKLLYQSGSALRVIQVLAMWALINLQMEYIPKAQVKLKLIEYMLGLRSLEEVKEMREKPATAKKSTTASSALEFVQSGMEPLRRMISLYASPIKSIKLLLSPSARSEGKFDHFLHMQCNDTLQQYEIFQWCCFMLGCLTARLHYLADNHENLEDFYEASQQWLDERLQTDLHISFQNIQLMRLQHYANFLRSQKKYEKALNCLQVALDSFSKMRGNVDNVYHINFLLQLNATKKEMSVSKQTESRGGLRRALTFNISPDLETPVSTAWNKLTTTAMKIYASDDSTPQRAAEPAKKSAHETNAQISKARKLRRQMAGEFPFKTPAKADIVNVKSSTKSLTARKIKELRAAKGDLFSSSSNNTPESDVDILNQCQRIQSIDLVDSDDANSKQSETPIVTVNTDANQINKRSVRKTGKHNENIMDICHKIESINLVDEPTVISSDSGTSTLQATATKAHTPEIVGITDDADSFKTPDSTFGKLTAPPKTTNTRGTSKKANCTTQTKCKSKESIANNESTETNTSTASSETTTIKPNDPQVEMIEKIKITEDKKATTTKMKTRTKTEVRTVKVITVETEVKIITPASQAAKKEKEKSTSGSTTRGRPRTARKAPSSTNGNENIAPPVTVGRTLSRRARQ